MGSRHVRNWRRRHAPHGGRIRHRAAPSVLSLAFPSHEQLRDGGAGHGAAREGESDAKSRRRAAIWGLSAACQRCPPRRPAYAALLRTRGVRAAGSGPPSASNGGQAAHLRRLLAPPRSASLSRPLSPAYGPTRPLPPSAGPIGAGGDGKCGEGRQTTSLAPPRPPGPQKACCARAGKDLSEGFGNRRFRPKRGAGVSTGIPQ